MPSSYTLAALIFLFFQSLQAQSVDLAWDNSAHSSFTLSIEYNLSAFTLSSITHDGTIYYLENSIHINSSDAPTTIQTYMSYEDPIDDIQESTTKGNGNWLNDYQYVSSNTAQTLIDLVKNGTVEYHWKNSYYEHLWNNGTSQSSVIMKKYPVSTPCPADCTNYEQAGPAASYGYWKDCFDEVAECIVYNCEYNGLYWGAEECSPLVVDSSVEYIESNFEAWWTEIEDYPAPNIRTRLVWGYNNPSSGNTYPNQWTISHIDISGGDLLVSITCSSTRTGTWYWDSGFFRYTSIDTSIIESGKVSYSLKNVSIISEPSVSITIGSNSLTQTISETIKQALSDKLGYQRIIMDDIGLYWELNSALSNASNWLFINESYFGYGCDQIMIDQYTWYNQVCDSTEGTCMNNVLSQWAISEHGISTLPFYNDINTIEVKSNTTKYSEDPIQIHFHYTLNSAIISIPSTEFAFKQPTVCNSVSYFLTGASVTTTNVSFTNCGTASDIFTYTINCANGYDSDSSNQVVAIDQTVSSWTSAVANAACHSISSINIYVSPCPEFWNSTCVWSTTLITPEPTPYPTDVPTVPPTPFPSYQPSFSPTAAPVTFFTSCTNFQVVPVRGAIGNVIVHQELCIRSRGGDYIIDINAQKPYYITEDSTSPSNTTINTINEIDYVSGTDSGTAATGSALIGHSIISIQSWFDVLAYLELDTYIATYLQSEESQTITSSIRMTGLNITDDIPDASSQITFKINLKNEILSALLINDNQITINNLRDGSIIADITLASAEINVNLKNFIASKITTSASILSPLNSVDNYYYANKSYDIVFTSCPSRITQTVLEGETASISWDEPTVRAKNDDGNIVVVQSIGETSGAAFNAGTYFIRYVSLSTTNSSIVPQYCSFVIIIDEEEFVIEFFGIEFSITTLTIIGCVLFFICIGSIIYSCIMRRRRKSGCCKKKEKKTKVQPLSSPAPGTFKSVVVSSHDPVPNKSNIAIRRATEPTIM